MKEPGERPPAPRPNNGLAIRRTFGERPRTSKHRPARGLGQPILNSRVPVTGRQRGNIVPWRIALGGPKTRDRASDEGARALVARSFGVPLRIAASAGCAWPASLFSRVVYSVQHGISHNSSGKRNRSNRPNRCLRFPPQNHVGQRPSEFFSSRRNPQQNSRPPRHGNSSPDPKRFIDQVFYLPSPPPRFGEKCEPVGQHKLKRSVFKIAHTAPTERFQHTR